MWHTWKKRGKCRVLVGKPDGKRPLGRPMRRWEDGIRMDFKDNYRGVWNGSSWLSIGADGGVCKYGDEPIDCGATGLVT
jgi:hypothetical protein